VIGRALGPVAVDQEGADTGVGAGVDIAPAVADHETLGEIDVVLRGGIQKEAWLRFAAAAVVWVVVPADADVVEHREGGAEGSVDGIDRGARDFAAGDVGLVGDNDEEVAGILEASEGGRGLGINVEIGEGGGRNGFAVVDDGFVEDAIAIEEDGFGHEIRVRREAAAQEGRVTTW
jgi:hypothetical protein